MANRFSLVSGGLAVFIAMLSTVPFTLQAQQVYRIVDPDGRVSFSDRPPVSAENKAASVTPGKSTGGQNNPQLPYELREVVSRYPVTLYTSANCGPCNDGRALLARRGIPFTEKTVSTNQDIEALQQLSGDASLPFATVGKQQLRGFSGTEWLQFLDAAGYPADGKLPSNYRNPEPTPFVAVATPSASTAAAADVVGNVGSSGTTVRTRPLRPLAPALSVPQDNKASNPAGIRF